MVEDLRIRLQVIDEQIEEQTRQILTMKTNGQATDAELRINEDQRETLIDFRAKIYQASTEAKLRINLANPRARIVDAATPPYADQPDKPDVSRNLSYAFCLALLAASIPALFSRFKA